MRQLAVVLILACSLLGGLSLRAEDNPAEECGNYYVYPKAWEMVSMYMPTCDREKASAMIKCDQMLSRGKLAQADEEEAMIVCGKSLDPGGHDKAKALIRCNQLLNTNELKIAEAQEAIEVCKGAIDPESYALMVEVMKSFIKQKEAGEIPSQKKI